MGDCLKAAMLSMIGLLVLGAGVAITKAGRWRMGGGMGRRCDRLIGLRFSFADWHV